jgi:hypothetical protein
MKGIPNQVILNKCSDENITVEELYMNMANGSTETFNLLNGSQCFKKSNDFQQFTRESFMRKLSFK